MKQCSETVPLDLEEPVEVREGRTGAAEPPIAGIPGEALRLVGMQLQKRGTGVTV